MPYSSFDLCREAEVGSFPSKAQPGRAPDMVNPLGEAEDRAAVSSNLALGTIQIIRVMSQKPPLIQTEQSN